MVIIENLKHYSQLHLISFVKMKYPYSYFPQLQVLLVASGYLCEVKKFIKYNYNQKNFINY